MKSKTRTMRGDRLHIGFFGRRNVGKSSLINALTGQISAIVSDVPGTTTDPVFKSMELQSLGPVVLIDTAGLDDDSGTLGDLRIKRTEKIFNKTSLALLVVDGSADNTNFDFEDKILENLERKQIPYIIVKNKEDCGTVGAAKKWLEGKSHIPVSSTSGDGIDELKKRITDIAPTKWEPPFLRDLVMPGDVVVLVTPIDLGAPKGRLIMPQVKALRDVLDADGIPVMCKERELLAALGKLRNKPALVVTDSQVFPQVAADVPEDVPLTSFSILSARQKGNLGELVNGVKTVKNLKPGDPVLIAESCTHHPMEDDIGRVKIPRWLNNFVGGALNIDYAAGADYPENLNRYKLVVHCGACTLNRQEMLWRQETASNQRVSITNYGLLISFIKGVFPRALKPFPELHRLFEQTNFSADHRVKVRMAALTDI